MIYTFINGQKKKIDTLYTFIDGQKKYIHTVNTFVDGAKKNIYIPPFHSSFYILLRNGANYNTNTLYVMQKESKKITRKIKLPVTINSINTKGYYNKQSKRLLLMDVFNDYVLIIDCCKNIVINNKSVRNFVDYGYNDELGVFYVIENDLSVLNIFDLINNEQYDISIPNIILFVIN